MGESYKGLTIRIGADTTALQKALRGVSSSIRTTQNHLSKIGRGLKFDSGDVRLLGTRMELLGDKLMYAAEKFQMLKRAESDFIAKNPELARTANETRNIAEQIAKASHRVGDANAKMAALHQKVKKLGKDNGIDNLSDDISKAIAQLKEADLYTGDLEEQFRMFRKETVAAKKELTQMEKIQSFRKLQLDMKVAEAELRSLAAQYVNARREISLLSSVSGFDEMRRDSKLTEISLENLRREAQTLQGALRFDPTSMELLKLKSENASDTIRVMRSRIEQVQASIDHLNGDEMQKLASEFRKSGKSAAQVEKEFEDATAEVKRLEGALNSVESEMDKIGREKGIDSSEYREAAAEASRLESELSGASRAMRSAQDAFDGSRVESDLRAARVQAALLNAELKRVSSTARRAFDVGSFGSKLRSFSASLQSSVTPAVMMMGTTFLQSAEDIDSAYRNMRKTVEGTEAQFDELKQAAMDTASQSIVSADTILQIEAMGGQLGIGVTGLKEFATTVSNLDIATDLDANTAAEQLGKLNGILDIGEENFDNFGDALVRLGNNTPALESDILDITTRFGSMGKLVGMSADEMLAWADAITSSGVKAEAGGSSMQRTLSNVNSWISESGDKFEKLQEISGLSAETIKGSWGEEGGASYVLKKFVDGLHQLDEQGGDVDATLREFGITGVRDKQMLEALTNNTDTLTNALKMSKDAYDGQSDEFGAMGDAAREAGKKTEGFSGSIGILRNNVHNLGSVVGDALVPFIDTLSGAIRDVTMWFDGLDQGAQQAIISMVGLAAAVGPAANMTGAFLQVAGSARSSLMRLAVGGESAAMSAAELSSAFMGMDASARKANIATGLLNVGWKGAAGACAALGAILVGVLVKKFIDYERNAKNLEIATKGLTSSYNGLGEATRMTAENIGSSINSVRKANDELLEDTVRMTEGWTDSWNTIRGSKGTLDLYIAKIEELRNKEGELTNGEQQQLNEYVRNYNELTGASVAVTDALNGEISATSDELRDMADAWYAEARAKQYSQQASDLVGKEIELTDQLAKAQANLDEAKQGLDEHMGTREAEQWAQKVAEAEAEVKRLTAEIDANKTAQEEMLKMQGLDAKTQELAEMAKTASGTASAFSDGSRSAADFATFITKMGVSAEDFGNMAPEMREKAVGAFDAIAAAAKSSGKDVASMSDDLASAGISFEDLSGIGVDAFGKLYEKAGGDLGRLKDLIDQFNGMTIEEKEAFLGIDKSEFDEGIEEANTKEVDDKEATITANDGTDPGCVSAEQRLGRVPGEVTTDLDASDNTKTPTDSAKSNVNSVPSSKTTHIYAEDHTGSVIEGVKNALSSIKDKVVKIQGANASGGIARFASGGISDPTMNLGIKPQILNRATMTTAGWAGEAGAEAIIPLTNRHYVRPFARAVAEEFADLQGGGNQSVSYNIYINGAKVNDDAMVSKAVYDAVYTISRKARMR